MVDSRLLSFALQLDPSIMPMIPIINATMVSDNITACGGVINQVLRRFEYREYAVIMYKHMMK